MMISTRGRYVLQVLIDLAEHEGNDYIPMKEIANRQGISLKYLEQIVPSLSKTGFVEGVHDKGGGYLLVKAPEDICVGLLNRYQAEKQKLKAELSEIKKRQTRSHQR